MDKPHSRWVIIPAGGIGSRMGLPYPKQLLPFQGNTVIERVLDLFHGEQIIVAVPAEYHDTFTAKIGHRARIVDGGETRFDSVRLAFHELNPDEDDLVLIHDAARPFLDRATLADAWNEAQRRGALLYAAPATDTIKRVDGDGAVSETIDRNTIYLAQTPQIFSARLLRQAYLAFTETGGPTPTDEASLLERAGIPVHIFPSTPKNRKLTLKEDLALLEGQRMAIGHGYDVHRYDEARPLYLCGVRIEGGPGLAGHSDADVALHALIDALLGAAGLGDIGQHFPDTSDEFKDIRSTVLLQRVWHDLKTRGFQLANADITIEAQIPKLAPHIQAMRGATSEILDGAPVNVKATTTEGLGFVGRKEGMAAHAVVLLHLEVSP